MNRSMRSVLVGAAGLAVLGMTATLAGAQTDEVKEKPPLAAGAHPAAFTLNDVMQAPFAWDMVAAPTGTAVAWVFNAKGCSNIWVAGPRGAKARQITSYTGDDGFDVGELAWSPDTKSIAFTRGQGLEDETPANVNSSPQGPMPREVWVVATAGGAPHKVGAGGSPIFSPDGGRLLFVDKKRILTVAASGDGEAQPLLIDQGTVDSLTWAPDGKRLAFVSHRGSHSLIGVYDFVDQTIVWLSPSLDYDSSPAFSPDGARIAFIHVPAEIAPDFFSRRSGRPWSIWTADVNTGQGRRIWIADAGPGSVFRPTISVNNDTPSATNLFWTYHDDLVFPWEKSGWQHLYAIPVRGGAVRALTAGKFEVTHVAFSHDRKRLAYSSTQDDTDRMHIWTVDAEHGSAVRIAQGHAIEDFPQFGADGALFAVQSDGNQPVQPVALSAEGQWRRLAPEAIPSSFPSSRLVMPQAVTFSAKDGQETHAQLFLPRDTSSKPRPAILFFHGGPQRQMLLGFDPKRTYSWIYAFNQYLVAQGYIVLSVNYRGGTGYGLEYREADNFGPGGASELNDVLGAITYLRGRQDVDSHRLGIWGPSYGGFMTALGLARASDALAAGVDYSGIHDWSTFLPSVGVPIDGGDAKRRAMESSPMATIDQWHSPVLLVQADDDRAVPSQQATELIEGLRSHNIDHDVILVPNEIHDMARYSSWMMLFNAANGYFDRKLNKRSAPASSAQERTTYMSILFPPNASPALPSEPEGIPAALDAAITGPADKDRARMKALLIPEARLMAPTVAADGSPSYKVETLDDWIARVKARGHAMLEEKQLKYRIERYGNIAHLWSSYTLQSDGKQVARGINSIQAIKEAAGWRVTSIMLQAESPASPLPKEYLP
jgi:dipeptidyl aminopeptidase/acylaminoacyl peptidase